MNRKAMGLWDFLLGALVLIVLAAVVFVIIGRTTGDTTNILECPGSCEIKEVGCTSPRVLYTFKSCPNKEGQSQVCCATPQEITGLKTNTNTGNTGGGGSTGNTTNTTTTGRGIIEVRMNEDASPIGIGASKTIKEKEETQFHFWVHNGPAKKCSAKFLDDSGKAITNGPFSEKIDITDCLGANKKQTLSITPIYEGVKRYKLQVLLYGDKANSEADALEGAWMYISVEKACPTKCEELTTSQECTTPSMVTGCNLIYPTFNCEWDMATSMCKTK